MGHRGMMWGDASYAGEIGVARRDITPPVGIYARNWGASSHDAAEGVHRPLYATALSIRARGRQHPLMLIALDAGWFRSPESAAYIRQYVVDRLGLPSSHLMLALSHTHAGPSISLSEGGRRGGEFIRPYMEYLRAAIVDAAREADANEEPAVLSFATGRCGLAANRDLYDDESSRVVCGFNPEDTADDTLLVGRVTRRGDNKILATLVNYACHPTTLGQDNRLISPDYVGAMREVVEKATHGAPCLFLQGASGELAPREQYTADVAVAERNGQMLGQAVLATLATMLTPGHALVFDSVVESGAPLAVWRPAQVAVPVNQTADESVVELPLKSDLPTEEQLLSQLEACEDRALSERLHRKLNVLRTVGPGPVAHRPVWSWITGDIFFFGHSDEAYSHLQRELRAAFPKKAVVVMNVVNGWGGYLSPTGHYGSDIYQVWQSPYDRGGLEVLIRQGRERFELMLRASEGGEGQSLLSQAGAASCHV